LIGFQGAPRGAFFVEALDGLEVASMKLDFRIFKYYPFGGLERNFLRITEECVERGHAVTIRVGRWEGDIPAFLDAPGCGVVEVPATGFSNHAFRASYVRNLPSTLDGPSDLVVGFKQMPGLDLYYAGDVCYAFEARSRPFSMPRRLTARDRLFREYERAIFAPESNTRILELSAAQRAAYSAEYGTPPDRFFPIPPGIDKERIRGALDDGADFRRSLGVSDSDAMVLMVGSDFKRKGVERSIRGLAALPPELGEGGKLFVVGEGDPRPLKRLAERLGVSDRVFFEGGRDDVPKYLAAADMLSHPAVSENTGNAIVEALVAGLPVITTSNCGYAFHVERAEAGAVVPGSPFAQSAFDAALSDILSDLKSRREEWRSKALEYSDKEDLYGRPVAVADIIEGLVEEKRRANGAVG